MIKGKESSLIVENVVKSIKTGGFLASSYLRALRALCDYIEITDPIRRELSSEDCPSIRDSILYRSPQNIIAFSGKRGSGKSSTMLSLSEVLGNGKKWKDLCALPDVDGLSFSLKNRRFVVIDPIDPTTLETNQSILSVILSRLLFIAEREWSQRINFYGSFQDNENKKTDLLVLARRCLNGIRSVKEKKDICQDLSDLQRIGDSSILKKDLYDFVELLLQFCNAAKDKSEASHTLVLQIDDTDCQISRGHETMEDIRKYLTLPNVLILMATDTKLLRKVLAQHYAYDFSENLRLNLVDTEEIRRLGEKHLAKLIPPSHVIHLPKIDEVIRDQTDLIHIYYYEDETKIADDKHLLDPCEEKDRDYENYSYQSVILRYIYRKTHIVFSAHSAYANNIIPTTLRGLAYLLGQLSSMEDVPEIDLDHKPFSADYLASGLEAQFTILDRNLNLFETYFLHNWVPAKLPQNMVEILEKISIQTTDQRIPFIMEELTTYYGPQIGDLNKFPFTQDYDYDAATFADLDEQLRIIQGTHTTYRGIQFRQTEDFYFIFAIRTLLTIKNNKEILRLKHKNVEKFQSGRRKKLVFNYLKEKTSLPTGFYLDPVELYGYPLVDDETGIAFSDYLNSNLFTGNADRELFCKLYLDRGSLNGGIYRRFNFTGNVVRWLAPEEDDYVALNQKDIFIAQEIATLMAANCDVQEVARKSIVRETRLNSQCTPPKDFSGAVQNGLNLIQNAIANINQEMLKKYKGADKSDWKISSQFKSKLNDFYAWRTEKPKIESIPFHINKFEFQIPTQYRMNRFQIFYRELNAYIENLREDIFNQKNGQQNRYTDTDKENIKKIMKEILEFKFKKGKDNEVTNGEELKKLLDKLYKSLDDPGSR